MTQLSIKQKDITQSVSVAQQISNYAQASITLVPRLDNPPSWYSEIAGDISTAQGNSQNWLDVLCPATSSQLPRTITSFNRIFQAKTAKILNIIKGIKGKISDQEKENIHNLFEAIIASITAQHTAADIIERELKKYIIDANQDQANLTKGLAIIKANDLNGASNISVIQNVMGESFLNNTVLGPCNVIVNIDINITIKINKISTNPELLAFAFISEFVNNMIANIKAIQIPLQSYFDLWTNIMTDYQTLITDLDSASDDSYLGIIEQLDLKQSRKDWKALATFVSTTLSN